MTPLLKSLLIFLLALLLTVLAHFAGLVPALALTMLFYVIWRLLQTFIP